MKSMPWHHIAQRKTPPVLFRRSGCRHFDQEPAGRSHAAAAILLEISLVASSTSKSNLSANFSSKSWTPSARSRVSSFVDRVPQVSPMKVRISSGELLSASSPYDRSHAKLRPPMELYECRFTLLIQEAVGVYTESLHHSRKERGIVRSDMIHISICVLSGISDAKSQKVS